MKNSHRLVAAAALGLALAGAGAGPALAAPPLSASCHGQFNGTINPALQGTGQLNAAAVHADGGRTAGAITSGEAKVHGVDCSF